MAAEIMDVIQTFFSAKSLKINTALFSVLDGTNSISGKKNGLQKRIRYYSPFSIYINCKNHRLALSLPHLMKDICLGEIINDYGILLLELWEIFHFSKIEVYFNFRIISGYLWEETVKNFKSSS